MIIQHLPRDAALWGSMRAAEAERRGVQVEPGFDVLEAMRYGELEHLTASLLDAVNWLVWSKTTDGAEGNNRPAPVHRPGQPPVRVEPAAIGWNDPLAQAYRAEMTTPE